MKAMYLLFLLMGAAGAAAAQAPLGTDAQVPPALRVRPAQPSATGAALRAQVLAKLEAQFRAADADRDGRLSASEAKEFGFVAKHFDAIDVTHRGAVTFDELRAFLARAKAEANAAANTQVR